MIAQAIQLQGFPESRARKSIRTSNAIEHLQEYKNSLSSIDLLAVRVTSSLS